METLPGRDGLLRVFVRGVFVRAALCAVLFWGFLTVFTVGALAEETASVPLDEAGFTEFVSKAFAKVLPAGLSASVAAPLAIKIRKDDKSSYSMNLNALYRSCREEPEVCAKLVALHVGQAVPAVATAYTPPDRKSLRLVIRTQAYVDEIKREQAGTGDPAVMPLIAGLWAILVADKPTVIETVTPDALEKLGLSRAEGLALGTDNVEAALPALKSIGRKAKAKEIGLLTGDPYESSLFLFIDRWAPVAKHLKGKLIVAIPASDVVLYAKENNPESPDALAAVAREVMRKSRRPITDAVFRWSPDGWKIALQARTSG